jgi:hypothetical protein
MARNPVATAGAQTYRAFRKGERTKRTQQAGQQPDPNNIVPPSLDYNYAQF